MIASNPDGAKERPRLNPRRAFPIPSRAERQDYFWTWMTLTMLNGLDAAMQLGFPAERNPLASLAAIRPKLEQKRQPILARLLTRIAHRILMASYRPDQPLQLGKRQRAVFQSLRFSLEFVWWLTWLGNAAPSCLTVLAVLLAGRKRWALADEWTAHLAGDSGHDPVTWRKLGQSTGFLVSGIRFRLADAADLAWRPTDAILASRFLSNLLIWGLEAVMLYAIVRHDGRFGLVSDVQDPVALGLFLYGAIRTGRWWRGVQPPEPKSRRGEDTVSDIDQKGPTAEG